MGLFSIGWWVAKWAAVKALGWTGVWSYVTTKARDTATGNGAQALGLAAAAIAGILLVACAWLWLSPPAVRKQTGAEVAADVSAVRAQQLADQIEKTRAAEAAAADEREKAAEAEARAEAAVRTLDAWRGSPEATAKVLADDVVEAIRR